MFTLIKKDFLFSKKYIIITTLFCTLSPLLLILDGDNLYHLLSFYIPMVMLGVLIGKTCYLEDSSEVRVFLKSLPYKRSSLVISKYIEMLILVLISVFYVSAVQIILNKGSNIKATLVLNILVGAFFIFYYSIYLYLYFAKNYNVAQNTMYFILGLVFIFLLLFNRNIITVDSLGKLTNNFIVASATILSLILCYLSIIFSIKGDY